VSTTSSNPALHKTEPWLKREMSETLVFSIVPAKRLNFNGTVEPPLTVFQTGTVVLMSTG